MALGLVGHKVGMTRIFNDDGHSIPITVLEITANRVTQIKNKETDGYNAIQLTYGEKKTNKLNKSEIGHFAKSSVEAGIGLVEFTGSEKDFSEIKLGDKLEVSMFADTKFVDITGISKGKGFSGSIKRHNFSSQRASHGNSLSHNAPGSIGQCQDPGRVFKGKKMAGQLGNKKITVQNLKIIRIDSERQLLLVQGAVPGAINGTVTVRPSVKKVGA